MSAIFGRKKQGMKPAATGLELQTASNAVPVPIVWGRGRLAPNIIWYNNFKSRKVKVGGGKGGPSQKQWEYSVSLILGICEGPINDVNNVWKDLYYKEAGNSFKSANSAVELLGSYSQTPWSYVTTNFPDEALSYRGIAYLGLPNYDLGTSPSMPQHSFEVNGLLYNTAVGGTEPDADPADLIWDFLTNENYGTPYLQSAISQSTLFSTVNATTTGDNTYQTYCRAMGFGLSPELTDTEEASKILERWLMLTNTAPVWSGNQLKFMPYGDETVSANGVVYVPEVTVRYNLTVDDFIWSEGEDPVTYVRGDVQDAKNAFYVEVMDRDDEYSLKPVGAKDQASIEEYGKRQNVDVKAHEIKTIGMGLTIAHLLVQRSAFVRNKYRFKLPQNFILLEAMDVVTLTVEGLGLDAYRVRITVVEENDDGELEIEAEDFPEGLGSTGNYSTQTSGGAPLNFNQAPGDTEAPIIFEPDGVLTNGVPQVWMGVTGLGAYWGGCEVWLSTDNTNYYQIGDITADQRIGQLSAALAAYASGNPDTVNTLSVDLTDSKGELESGDATDVANGANLAYVDGELLTFQTATLTAEYEYDLTTLYRGLYGTTAGSHLSATNFMYLDESVFTYDLPQEYIGQTLYLKFLSVNIFGGSVQQLSDVSAYTYTPTGVGYTLNAPTGVTITPVNTTDGSGNAQISLKVDWTASTSGLIDRYEVQVSVDGSGVWTSAPTAGGDETTSTFVGAAANTNYLARVRAVRTTGTNASSSWASSAATGSGAGASTVPNAPTSFTATGSAEANFLQWAAPATLPITGYKIYAINEATGNFIDSSLIGTVGAGTLNFIHAGLASEDTWRYWVVAYNAAGNSTEAGPQNATTSASGGGSVSVEDDGSEIVAAASTLNFTGTGVSVSDAGGGQVDIDISGGGGGGGSSPWFNGATGDETTQTASAYATKGTIITPLEDITIDAVWGIVDPASSGQNHNAVIAEVASVAGGVISAITATSATVAVNGTQSIAQRFAFASPVTLTAGTPYLIAVSNTSGGGTTALRANITGLTSAEWAMNAPVTTHPTAYNYNTTSLSVSQSPSTTTTAFKMCFWVEGSLVAGNYPLTKPSLSDFPTGVNVSNLVTADGIEAMGLAIPVAGGGGSGADLQARVKTLPATPVSCIAKVRFNSLDQNNPGQGIVVRDSSSSRFIMFGNFWSSTLDTDTLQVVRFSNSTTYNSSPYNRSMSSMQEVWLKVDDDGSSLTFSYSMDGGAWIQVHTETHATWLAAPDQVGFGFTTATLGPMAMGVLHYSEA